MKVIALDSSGLVASVAIVEDDRLIAEYTVDYKKTHSQTLLPMLDEIVRMTETDLHSVDAIALACGPGSFTGLRIGAATAKGLGLALQKPVISVPTVDAMAFSLYGAEDIICPVMDARRSQVYTGLYSFDGDEFHVIEQQKAVSVEELAEELNEIGQRVLFLGDGVPVYRELLKEKLEVPYLFTPAHVSRQRAGAVGALAVRYGMERSEAAADHKPVYLRQSQAERERQEREGREGVG